MLPNSQSAVLTEARFPDTGNGPGLAERVRRQQEALLGILEGRRALR